MQVIRSCFSELGPSHGNYWRCAGWRRFSRRTDLDTAIRLPSTDGTRTLAETELACSASNASTRNFVAQLRTISLPYGAQTGQEPASPPRIARSALVMS